MTATKSQNQNKRQTLHLKATAKYSEENSETGRIILAAQIIVFVFSIATMYFAVVQFAPFLIIIGIGIEISNAFVQAEIARTQYAKNQYTKGSHFQNLLPIPTSRINLSPVLYAIIFFWIVVVSFSAYHSAESRNRIHTEGVTSKIDSFNQVLISLNSEQITDEKSRIKKVDSLNNCLSLQKSELKTLSNRWAKRDEWTKTNYYYPVKNGIEKQVSIIESSLKSLNKPVSKAQIEHKNRIEQEINDLQEKRKIAESLSFYDKWRDFFIHILLMLVSIAAIRYTTFAKVKYKILCGKGFKIADIEVEQVKEKQPSKTDTMKQALKSVFIEREGRHKKIVYDVDLQTLLSWKKNPKYHGYFYKAMEIISLHYEIVKINMYDGSCPTIIKK